MAVRASYTITITKYRDAESITRFYLLQASTLTPPTKPETLTPPEIQSAEEGWTDVEPHHISGSTNTLYFVDRSVFSDGTFSYSEVSIASNYEAAKESYNKAQAAQNTANSTKEELDNLEIGGRNYLLKSDSEFQMTLTSTNNQFYDVSYSDFLKKSESRYFVISFDAKYTGDDDNGRTLDFYLRRVPEAGSWIMMTELLTPIRITKEYKRYHAILKLVHDEDVSNVGQCRFRAFMNSNGIVYIKNYKLEEGNKQTSWTPAPEDIENELDDYKAESEVIVGTQTTSTANWTGNANFKELKDGQQIIYWLQ